MEHESKGVSRRRFLARSLGGGALCLAGLARPATAADSSITTPGQNTGNPFAYDVDRLGATDPKLVRYQEVRTIRTVGTAPRRIAVGPSDTLYIATNTGVQVIDGEGNHRKEVSTASPARAVAVAEDGSLYVALRTNVEVYSADGQLQAKWEPPTRKSWLTGICLAGDDVFAADSANRVVFRYDRTGKVHNKIGEKNLANGYRGLIVPSPYLDVKAGRDGLLRVNNPGFHRVELFTPEGEWERSWGKATARIDGFCGCCNPIGLSLLPDGRCVTCEKGLPRVKVYSADGSLDCVVAGPESFRQNAKPGQLSSLADGTLGGLDAAVDSKGLIYVLDLVAAEIRVMQPKTSV